MHPNLTWSPALVMDDPKERHAIVNSLVSRGIVPKPKPFPGVPGTAEEEQQIHPPPTSVLLLPEVAAWAERTVISGVRAVAKLPPKSVFRTEIRRWAEFTLGQLEPLTVH